MEQTQHSPTYASILRAGPRLRPLQQVHATLIVSGLHRTRSLLTKLLTLAISAGSARYARRLLRFSVPSPDAFLFTSLITSCSKSNLPVSSVQFYRQMLHANFPPSNYTFTAVIKACADISHSTPTTGRALHTHVIVDGFNLDPYVQTALITFYAKCGNIRYARMVFDRIAERTVVAWNSMMSGYEQNGLSKEAVEVFFKLQEEGVEPDRATLTILVSACSQMGALGLGKWAHGYAVERGFDVGVVLGTALINMYARCGDVEKAGEVFDGLRERNVVAWTAMISGYGMNGCGDEAVDLFHRMTLEGPEPNNVTFVAVLSACAHAGLVEDGRHAFDLMKRVYGLTPGVEHHVCMVDMLGRVGHLNEALQFVKDCIPFEPGAAVWTALLGACKMHKNFELGVEVAERLLAIEPDNPSHYVLLSNIYALAGRMDLVEKIRNVMTRSGLKKQTGYSLIEIDRVPHLFRMGETSHPQTGEIYKYLEELIREIKKVGYTVETDSMLHDLEEEEREFTVRFHSEKLAVAFGLMSTQDAIIRVVKNLRICDDCHSAIKYMSVVSGREIIVRDKHRFHHFKDGLCSCKDFW